MSPSGLQCRLPRRRGCGSAGLTWISLLLAGVRIWRLCSRAFVAVFVACSKGASCNLDKPLVLPWWFVVVPTGSHTVRIGIHAIECVPWVVSLGVVFPRCCEVCHQIGNIYLVAKSGVFVNEVDTIALTMIQSSPVCHERHRTREFSWIYGNNDIPGLNKRYSIRTIIGIPAMPWVRVLTRVLLFLEVKTGEAVGSHPPAS